MSISFLFDNTYVTAIKGDKWFMQEHNCKGSSSKVADMAAANLSGNGIMGYNSSNSNDTSTCPGGS